MNSNEAMQDHIQLENLNARLVPTGIDNALMLAVRSLTAGISRDGLEALIRHLIPQEPLQVTIIDRPESTGCQIRLQATRWGFTPRIIVAHESSSSLPGGILIDVDPVNRWSPLDRTMLTIATSNPNKIARSQPEITRLQAGRYQLDLQRLIRDRLLDSSAPVRWDARLDRIDSRSSDIRVLFVSNMDDE